MEKKDLASILNEILVPIGFKKKGDYWVINGNEITKMVNLQKSQFSNRFYVNYGYVLNAIPLNDLTMHVFNGLSSLDSNENAEIKNLLDLESDISNENRASKLKKLFSEKIVRELSMINTEEDLLEALKHQQHLNNVPLIVKRHFNLLE